MGYISITGPYLILLAPWQLCYQVIQQPGKDVIHNLDTCFRETSTGSAPNKEQPCSRSQFLQEFCTLLPNYHPSNPDKSISNTLCTQSNNKMTSRASCGVSPIRHTDRTSAFAPSFSSDPPLTAHSNHDSSGNKFSFKAFCSKDFVPSLPRHF